MYAYVLPAFKFYDNLILSGTKIQALWHIPEHMFYDNLILSGTKIANRLKYLTQ